jgi:hypothetical protein
MAKGFKPSTAWRVAIGAIFGFLAATYTWRVFVRNRERRGLEHPMISEPKPRVARAEIHATGSPIAPEIAEGSLKPDRRLLDSPLDSDGDRITFRIPIVTWFAAAAIVLVAASSAWRPAALSTITTVGASTRNGASLLQAGLLRFAAPPSSAEAFTIPSLLPGETVERVFAITLGGTVDASLTLQVIKASPNQFAFETGGDLEIKVSRCDGGSWVSIGGASPDLGYACTATSGSSSADIVDVYRGPLVPPGSFATLNPVSIPVSARVAPGQTVSVRLRATLPIDATASVRQSSSGDANRPVVLSLDWRAVPAVTNDVGVPVSSLVAVPEQSTQLASEVPSLPVVTPLPPGSLPQLEPSATLQPTPTQRLTEDAGYAVAFDGVGAAIELVGSPVSLATHDDWTIEAWVRPDSFEGAQAIYTENVAIANGATGMVLGLGLMDRQLVVGGLPAPSSSEWIWTDAMLPTDLVPGTWFHVAATRTGQTVTIYVDGTVMPSASPNGALWTSLTSAVPSTYFVGRAGNPEDASYFHGQVDDLRLWTVGRNGQEVAVARHQRLLGTEAGLVGSLPVSGYPLSSADGHGTSIINQATGSHTALLRGDVKFVASGAEITAPPTPNLLTLALTSDSGMNGDRITNASAITINGFAEPGSVVQLYRDGTAVVPTVTVNPNGMFETKAELPSDTSYLFTARARNAVGASGLQSRPLIVFRGATPPAQPTTDVNTVWRVGPQ